MFNRVEAARVARGVVSVLLSSYPPGALEWIAANRPDVERYLCEAEQGLEEAFEQEDGKGFAAALGLYAKRVEQAIDIYLQRPPVVEVSGVEPMGMTYGFCGAGQVVEGESCARRPAPSPFPYRKGPANHPKKGVC